MTLLDFFTNYVLKFYDYYWIFFRKLYFSGHALVAGLNVISYKHYENIVLCFIM